jgi:predicted HTH domain antitoxin
MKTFTVRDIREHTGALIHGAEIGKLSLVTKHGHPVFLAVPFSEDLLELGLRPAMAIKLYKEGTLTLGKAAKLAGDSVEGFMDKLSHIGVPVVNFNPDDLSKEIKDFE